MTRLRPWRLLARIYGFGLFTLAILAASLLALVHSYRAPPGLEKMATYLTRELWQRQDDRATMQTFADELGVELAMDLVLFSPGGAPIVATPGSELAKLPAEVVVALADGDDSLLPFGAASAVLRAADGRVAGFGLLQPQFPVISAGHALSAVLLVLLILAGVSTIFARGMLVPLRRLAAATQAFGAGDVQARVGLRPGGAFGELGAVFDEMAGQVTALLQAQRGLLADVSHELRTPLARLRVALAIAADSDAQTARAELLAADDDLDQLQRLVEDVLRAASLDLATLQRGGASSTLRRERIALAGLIERTARRAAAAFPTHPVFTRVADEAWAEVDPALLRQAVDNLLDNARKYSETGAAIEVEVESRGAMVMVAVSDRGIGIAAEDQPHLFSPFFRVDRSRTRSTGGVGLGLTLVRRIVEAHGGSVSLVSAPGRGTRVELFVPRARET